MQEDIEEIPRSAINVEGDAENWVLRNPAKALFAFKLEESMKRLEARLVSQLFKVPRLPVAGPVPPTTQGSLTSQPFIPPGSSSAEASFG